VLPAAIGRRTSSTRPLGLMRSRRAAPRRSRRAAVPSSRGPSGGADKQNSARRGSLLRCVADLAPTHEAPPAGSSTSNSETPRSVRVATPQSQDESILSPPQDRPLGAIGAEGNAARAAMHEIHDPQLLVAAHRDETPVRRPQATRLLVADRDRRCVRVRPDELVDRPVRVGALDDPKGMRLPGRAAAREDQDESERTSSSSAS
jgi:hypothetical protein